MQQLYDFLKYSETYFQYHFRTILFIQAIFCDNENMFCCCNFIIIYLDFMAIKLERTCWFPNKYLISVLDSNPGNISNDMMHKHVSQDSLQQYPQMRRQMLVPDLYVFTLKFGFHSYKERTKSLRKRFSKKEKKLNFFYETFQFEHYNIFKTFFFFFAHEKIKNVLKSCS